MFENKAYWSKALPVLILGTFLMFFYAGLQNDHLNVLTTHYQNSPIGFQSSGENPEEKNIRVLSEMSDEISRVQQELSNISSGISSEMSKEEKQDIESLTTIKNMQDLTDQMIHATGWTNKAITNPVTIASIVGIALTFLIGTMMITYGVVKVLVPSIIVLGISTIGLGISREDPGMYSICLFMMRLFVVPLVMGGFMLCTNWFIKLRGRALGLITIGCPLFTATGILGLTMSIGKFGITNTYVGVGIIVLVLALLVALFIKSRPEDCGLYPDGADQEINTSSGEIKSLPAKEVLANSGSWLLIISFGLLQFCIVAMMAFYVPKLASTGTEPRIYFFWLSMAAIMGMPISFILGIIDDKFGTVIASLALCATFVMALLALLFMTANNIPLIFLAALGIAGVIGGTPNLHPSITAYVWGRDRYQAANRWIMAIQAIMMAFAILFMSEIADRTGSFNLGYKIMLGFVAIAVVCLIIIGRKPDYDRQKLS